jgi:glycosyltransferase involved in cell wall biosynthesis
MEAGTVFVVPLRGGGGTRLKFYEALAMERPLVSTTIGAEGLPLEHGVLALIADGAKPFADAVLGLLSHPRQASAMALTGAGYVRASFGWDRAAAKFIDLVSSNNGSGPQLGN